MDAIAEKGGEKVIVGSIILAVILQVIIVKGIGFFWSPLGERGKTVSFSLIAGVLIIANVVGYSQYKYQIGNPWEYADYKAQYFVNIFPEDSKAKNYRVKADIERTEGFYYITKAYFPTGGSISFQDSYGVTDLTPYKTVMIQDDNNRYWSIELTKERIK